MRHLTLIFLCLTLAVPAYAHHGAIAPDTEAQVQSRMALEYTTADYSFGDKTTGSWHTFALLGEYAPLTWLSLSATVPLSRTAPSDGAGDFGLSDIEVGFRILALHTKLLNMPLRIGLDAELPTGNTDDGLGGGHTALVPHISYSLQPHKKFTIKAPTTIFLFFIHIPITFFS